MVGITVGKTPPHAAAALLAARVALDPINPGPAWVIPSGAGGNIIVLDRQAQVRDEATGSIVQIQRDEIGGESESDRVRQALAAILPEIERVTSLADLPASVVNRLAEVGQKF